MAEEKDGYHLVIQKAKYRRKIFLDGKDYDYYLRLLQKYAREFRVKIFAFCLMAHCVYFVVQTENGKDLSDFLLEINKSYMLFYNARYDWEDFSGKRYFRRVALGGLEEVCRCVKFVELKPVKSGFVDDPARYPWSSYNKRGPVLEL